MISAPAPASAPVSAQASSTLSPLSFPQQVGAPVAAVSRPFCAPRDLLPEEQDMILWGRLRGLWTNDEFMDKRLHGQRKSKTWEFVDFGVCGLMSSWTTETKDFCGLCGLRTSWTSKECVDLGVRGQRRKNMILTIEDNVRVSPFWVSGQRRTKEEEEHDFDYWGPRQG